MSYNLCDECIEKTGPFKLSEYQSENNDYCHSCHQGRPTKSVVGRRETCTNVRRCRGQTPVFPPEKYDEYTTGWHELRSEPYDPDFPLPPIWVHCPVCRAEEKTAEQVLDEGRTTPADKAVFGEPLVRGVLNQLFEQDIYKRTAEEQQQRFRDIADLGFTPTYVRSTPEFVGRFQVKELDHYKIQYAVGWDANGSPTEEWP